MEITQNAGKGDLDSQICLWTEINEMRASNMLCDTVLISEDGKQFHVHAIVLAASCPIFRAVFIDDVSISIMDVRKDGNANGPKIIQTLMDSDLLGAVIGYIYTKQLNTDVHKVCKVIEAARKLLMTDMLVDCIMFVKSCLTIENCLDFFEFARDNDIVELKRTCKNFILQHFHQIVIEFDPLKRLQFDDLREFLSDDLLQVRSEEDVFEVVISWISADIEKRSQHSIDLLNKVRLGLLQADYFLQKVTNHPQIAKNKSLFHPLLAPAWKFICAQEHNGSRHLDLNFTQIRPRIPRTAIVILGGWSGGTPIPNIEIFDPRAEKWYSQPQIAPSSPRAYHGLAAVLGMVYLIGGFDGSNYYSSVSRFDPVSRVWKDVAPMYFQRCYVSVSSAEGMIYACGGFDGRSRLRAAERYHPSSNQWERLPNMLYRRSDAGAANLGRRLYIAGGFNGELCLRSVEVYDPDTVQWTEAKSTTSVRSGLCLAAHRNQIYAIGGFDGERRLRTVERYSESSGRWEEVGKMNLPRSNFATATLEGKLYVIGGFNGNRTIRNVESFDVETSDWQECCGINLNRSAFQACVLADIPNMPEYTFHGKSREARL